MYSDYIAPIDLQLVSTVSIPVVPAVSLIPHNPALITDPSMQLKAIVLADFSVIYQALSDGNSLTYWQQFAVKRIRYDKSGRMVELALRNKIKALNTLCKTLGYC